MKRAQAFDILNYTMLKPHEGFFFSKICFRDFPQGPCQLKCHSSTSGGLGSSMVRELRSSMTCMQHGQKKKKKAFEKDVLVSGPEILNYGRMSAPEIIPQQRNNNNSSYNISN